MLIIHIALPVSSSQEKIVDQQEQDLPIFKWLYKLLF